MTTKSTANLRISHIQPVDSPQQVCSELPISNATAALVAATRRQIQQILAGQDSRLLVVVGPCSIHDPEAALEYGDRLAASARALADDLLLVMRTYFEKPRTRTGWKGLINDPHLDESFDVNKGIRLARKLLCDLNGLGIPTGTEFLDIVTGQYIADLVSWGAIGARTTESQVHREMASGLSCPVGFKNGTDGNLQIACDAIFAAAEPHIFLSPTDEGRMAIFKTTGNPDTHLILRGGRRPNYDSAHVRKTVALLEHNRLCPRLMIDLSHANSEKQYTRQLSVGENVATQIADGETNIFGVMIESHLVEGRQDMTRNTPLRYGQSITDACLSLEQTRPLLYRLAEAVRKRRRR